MTLVGIAYFKVRGTNSTCTLQPFWHWNSSNTKIIPMTSLHFIIIKLLAVKADAYPTVGEIAGAGYKLFVQRDKMVVEFLVLFHCLGPASSWFRPGLAGGISFCLFLLFACFFLFVAGVSNNNHNSSSAHAFGGGRRPRRRPPPRFLLVH